jgi:hypothetical protein
MATRWSNRMDMAINPVVREWLGSPYALNVRSAQHDTIAPAPTFGHFRDIRAASAQGGYGNG